MDEADVAWFDANLAADFLNTNPDGTFIDRKAFLAQIGRGSSVKNIREHDVIIRILGDFRHHPRAHQLPEGGRHPGGRPLTDKSDHGTSCDLDHVDRSETMARCQWRADRLCSHVGGIGVSGGTADQD